MSTKFRVVDSRAALDDVSTCSVGETPGLLQDMPQARSTTQLCGLDIDVELGNEVCSFVVPETLDAGFVPQFVA